MKKALYDLCAGLHRGRAIRRLRELEVEHPSTAARLRVPFAFRGKGHFKKLAPRQNRVEIEQLYADVCGLKPTRVLEIGTARGGTLYLWTQAATDDATLVSVDLPGGDFGGAYPPCRIPFYESFARPGQTLHLLRDDSHAAATRERVNALFGGEPIDFAFIDGDHRYAGVRQDFEMYGPLVRPGGLVAFHDIVPQPAESGIEVERLWRELRDHHDTTEYVGPDGSGKIIGIGLIRVGDAGVGVTASAR